MQNNEDDNADGDSEINNDSDEKRMRHGQW